MTSVFSAEGKNVPCTVIEAGPCVVTQVKTVEKDGYEAVQLGFQDKKEKHTTKPLMGHFKKAGVTPKKHLAEFKEFETELNLGDTVTVELFNDAAFVDVVGTSKGKGFQGVVKRHGFGGVGQTTHGQHNRARKPGSIGACSYPAKVFKGMRMGGQLGGDRVTVQNLQVLKVIAEHNLLLIKGSVPGCKGSIVIIEKIMEVNVYNIKGEDTGRKITLNESIFGIEPNDHAIYLDVKQFMANQRQGTHKSKERSEISGSTRKIGRQKGGGGARRGDMNSPVLVGGGRVFGPKSRDYYFKLNKKVKTLARKSALSYKAQDNAIVVVEDFNFEAPKTKVFVEMTKNLKVSDKKLLVILPEANKNVYLSARNIEGANVQTISGLNTYRVLNAGVVVLTESSLKAIDNILI